MLHWFKWIKNALAPPGLGAPDNFRRDLHHQMMMGIYVGFQQSIAAIIILQILNGSSTLIAWVQAGGMFGLLLSPVYVAYGQQMSAATAYARPHIVGWVLLGLAGLLDDPRLFTAIVFFACLLFSLSTPFQAVMYEMIYLRSFRGKAVATVKQWHQGMIMLVSWLLGIWLVKDGHSYTYFMPLFAVFGVMISRRSEKIAVASHQVQHRQTFSLKRAVNILRSDRNFLWFMVLQSLLGVSNIAGVAVFQVYVNRSDFLGADPWEAALLTGVIPFAAMFVSIRVWGSIFDRMSVVYYRALSSLMMGLGFMIYAVSDSMVYVMLGVAVWGVGRGGGQLVWSIGVLAFAKSNDSATYLGIHTFLTGLRGVIAPFVGVAAIQSALSPWTFFGGTALLIILSAVLIVFVIDNPERTLTKRGVGYGKDPLN